MWTRFRLHAFLKVPPFSPSDCASLLPLMRPPDLNLTLAPILPHLERYFLNVLKLHPFAFNLFFTADFEK